MADHEITIKPEFNPEKVLPQGDKLKKALKTSIVAAGDAFMKEVAEGFDQQKTPGGNPWKELSPAYAKWKQKHASGSKILELSGTLKSAALGAELKFDSGAEGDGSGGNGLTQAAYFEVTTPVYAIIHEFGKGPIPARPFFILEGQARSDVEKQAFEAFDKALDG